MSNQTNKDFKQFQNMSLGEIINLINKEKEELKKDYKELRERKKLIKQYKNWHKLEKK